MPVRKAENKPRLTPKPLIKLSYDLPLRRTLRRLGIRWPGDGDYGHGVQVYMVNSRKVVRLVKELKEKGQYLTDDGMIYSERHGQLGWIQELRRSKDAEQQAQAVAVADTLSKRITDAIAAYIHKHGVPPTVLHISYDDLVEIGAENHEVAQNGNAWGLSIVLEARGQEFSLDRRIEL